MGSQVRAEQLWLPPWSVLLGRDPSRLRGSLPEGQIRPRHGHRQMLRSRMVIPLLKTQLLELARPQLLEQGYCPRILGEQVEVGVAIPGHHDGAVVNPVVDPMRRDPQLASDL